MKRTKIKELYAWKARANRKPLIVRGARQVGKTWLIQKFAEEAFEHTVYINFEKDEVLRHVFEQDLDVRRIIAAISLRMGVAVNEDTLLIFDEIQAAPRGVMSLKYFCEDAREQPVIAAGSLLGISLHEEDSFPVGKVDFLDLYPMTFREFLLAKGEKRYIDIVESRQWDMVRLVSDRLTQLLKEYYYVGGMPEVVSAFLSTRDYREVRRIQDNILQTYEADFSKHAPAAEVPRINMVWRSIAGQLAKENRKFIYGMLRQGARSKDYEIAIAWLVDAGLVRKVSRCKLPQLPLNAFEEYGVFKLYLLDVGLLSAINQVQPETLLVGNELFSQYKGALTEQYVLEQLIQTTDMIYYWSAENSRGEIDFLVQVGGRIIPIEVKAEENLKSKSLRSFVEKYPSLHGLRISMSPYRQQSWMDNMPLYALLGENN